jgi:hypothetical protein
MRGVKEFLTDSLPAMIDYILVVSTPVSDPYNAYPGHAASRHDRLNVVNSLRQRGAALPVLDREAIPLLPHLLDIPRHLAIITSAVIRNARDCSHSPNPHDQADRRLDEFCVKCFEVEEQALQRVSQLATRASDRRRSSPQENTNPTPTGHSPTSHIRNSSSSPAAQRRPPRKFARPSTAPAGSRSDLSHSGNLQHDVSRISLPSSRRRQSSHVQTPDSQSGQPPSSPDGSRDQNSWSSRKNKHRHPRSASTDSIPSHGIHPTGTSAHPAVPSKPTDTDTSDDASKKKKGLLRGILNRR